MGDYDRKPMEPPSQWLRLKKKGEEVRIRIGGTPLRELKVWPAEDGGKPLNTDMTHNLTAGQWLTLMRDPDWAVSEVFHFVVIDRADSTAKIFTTTGGVYGKIRDYANNNEWGNPTNYDLTIKRTESPGKNYYEVTPSPNKNELRQDDLGKLDSLNLQILLPNALPASHKQPDDIDANTINPEPLPWSSLITIPKTTPEPTAQPTAESVAIEDLGSEPINLDDIPF